MSKSVPIHIENSILQWILDTKLKNTSDNDNLQLVKEWLDGSKEPTLSKVEKLSRQIHVPFGYFLLNEPPEELPAMAEFRTLKSLKNHNPSDNLLDTISMMKNVQEWMHDYLIDAGMPELSYVGSQKKQSSMISLTAAFRDIFGIDENWMKGLTNCAKAFNEIKRVCTSHGILVFMNGIVGSNTRRKLNLEEFRAFSMMDAYAPLIFINVNDSETGRLFSLLHEMCHILMGENHIFDLELNSVGVPPVETMCNAVAAEILMPTKSFCKFWKEDHSSDVIEKVKNSTHQFPCSHIAAARKALELHLITRAQYHECEEVFKPNFKNIKKSGGGNYFRTQASHIDHRLLRALQNSILEGKTSYTEAFHLIRMNRVPFEKLIQHIVSSEGEGA